MNYSIDGNKAFIRLLKGEKLFESLERFAAKEKWNCAFVSGIGAVTNVEIGAYDLENKVYLKKTLTEIYELCNMQGNLCLKDGKPFYHLHGVLGDHHLNTLGGHFFEMEIAVTVEVKMEKLAIEATRELEEDVGLALLNFCPHHQV